MQVYSVPTHTFLGLRRFIRQFARLRKWLPHQSEIVLIVAVQTVAVELFS